jgi:hypothetical protein
MADKSDLKLISDKEKAEALENFLKRVCEPAFGSLSKKEIELAILEILFRLNWFQGGSGEFEISRKLGISLLKARNLIYERSLRKHRMLNDEDLRRELAKEIVTNLHCEEEDKVVIQIVNPYFHNCIREKLSSLRLVYDGSFSSHIIRVSRKSFLDLLDNVLTSSESEAFLKTLKKEGRLNSSVKRITDLIKDGSNFLPPVEFIKEILTSILMSSG